MNNANTERKDKWVDSSSLFQDIQKRRQKEEVESTDDFQDHVEDTPIPVEGKEEGEKEVGSYSANEIIRLYKQQEESVSFGDWLNKNAYPSYSASGEAIGWNLHKGMDGEIYSTGELYQNHFKS